MPASRSQKRSMETTMKDVLLTVALIVTSSLVLAAIVIVMVA
jgi:hypothetical protein